ncbi:hypothetical protein HWV62_33891 [Athelia sp. TMB]|nr:hypothetical protein HWV62_23885 [Athelia sp. TMB]KAF7981394.1 hypothetical protein HWV62_33891 [Athelia sp. TMB]
MSSTIASSAPPSPSVESFGSSAALSLDHKELAPPAIQTDELEGGEKKHPLYYFKDGSLTFLIEEKLYNVHRYFFERDSSYFRSILEGPQGTNDRNPLVIPGLSCNDFDEFLAILYPADFRHPTEKTTPQWTSILHLAAKWEFESIKWLAIDNLTANAVPVDKIVLGRRYGISEWLPGAYEAVCMRETSLTVEEGIKLGVEDVVKISAARQAYGCGKSRFERKYLSEDLEDIFGLDPSKPGLTQTGGRATGKKQKQRNAQGVGYTNDEDEAAIKALESEVAEAQAALLALPAPPTGGPCPTYRNTSLPQLRCEKCASCKPAETEEHRLKREDKEEKERCLRKLRGKRQQSNQELTAKQERLLLFQY